MPINEAKRRGNDKYNSKCDYISIRPLKPIGERIREEAEKSGKSLQGFILDAVNQYITTTEEGQPLEDEKINFIVKWLQEHGHTPEEITDFLRFGK